MTRLLDDVGDGIGGWLLVEGRPGTGKTALLQAFRAAAASRGMSAGLVDADATAPLGTLLRALAAAGAVAGDDRPIGRARSAAGDGGPHTLPVLRSQVAAMAADRPLAVIVDDASRADDASLEALRALSHDLAAQPVVWLLAARPEPGPDARPAYRSLRARVDGPGFRRLDLRPVDRAAYVEIARDVLGAEPDADVMALSAPVAGNLRDLLERLVEGERSGAFVVEAGRARLSAQAGPSFVADLTAPHLARLSPGARRLIDVAAVLGQTVRMTQLTALLGTSASRITVEIREVIDEGIVVDDGDLTFAHTLTRRAVLDLLPPPVYRAINRDIAAQLTAAGSSADEIAPYLVGGWSSAERTSGSLAGASDRLGTVPPVGAYLRALDLAVTGSRQWPSLVAPAARALAYAGRPQEANALLDEALARNPLAGDEAEIRLALAEVGWLRGRDPDQDPALERLMQRPGLAATSAAQLSAARGRLWCTRDGPVDALAAAEAAVLPSRSRRDQRLQCAVTLAASRALGRLGRFTEAVAYARQSASIAGRTSGGRTVEPAIWLAQALSALDRLDDAQGYCEDVLCEINERGNVSMLPAAHAVRARVLLARGQLVDAATEAQAGIAAAEATGATRWSVELLALLAFLEASLGDPHLMRQATVRGEDLVRGGVLDDGHLPLLRAAPLAADPGAALPACRALIDALGTAFGPLVVDPGIGPLLARVAHVAGDQRRLRAVRDAATGLAALNPGTLGWSAAQLHVEGLANGDAPALRDAARRFTKAGRHFAAAVALADAAVIGLRRGAPDASDWMDEASAVLAAMRAQPLLTEARQRFADGHAPGVKRVERAVSGWDSLTGAELRVVALAATGASNKEIARQLWLSPHTVGTHVRHALEKLGLRSRVEMARQAGERGITPAPRSRDLVLAYGRP